MERALIAVQQTAQRERLQRDVVASSRRAFDIAETRLREGTIDLVTVLNTQQTLFQAQDVLAQAQFDRLKAVVSLFQALGGGWQSPRKMRLAEHLETAPKAPESTLRLPHEMCVMCCESGGRVAIYGAATSGRLEMAIRRRSIATALVALVLIGAAAAVWWQPARQQQPRFGRGAGDDGPVPVIAALTKRSDVPVYLDGVGTIRALTP